jgi:hypothetical protein
MREETAKGWRDADLVEAFIALMTENRTAATRSRAAREPRLMVEAGA